MKQLQTDNKYNTILFDLDGTLLNTLEDLTDATNYVLALHHYPLRSRQEIRRFVGNGVQKLLERAIPTEVSSGPDAAQVLDQIFPEFKAYYNEHCNDKTAPYPGILELLRECKARGIRMGITSNKVRSAVEILSDIYFEGLIDASAGVAEGITPKPDPAMIEEVLTRLGSEKARTLYVGDSQVDVATARNAGLDMVTVLWGFRDEAELREAGATALIHEPEELLRYL